LKEAATSHYSLDWQGLERDTQRFNFEMLKEDFKKNQTLFLVNQLLMSVQFFKNYEK
jgi:hypothetical protein